MAATSSRVSSMAGVILSMSMVRRSVVFHGHEGLHLLGLPLVFFSLALAQVARLSKRLVGGCAIAAVVLFVVSCLETNRLRSVASGQEAPFRAMLSDFDTIRGIAPPDARVLVPYVSGGYDSTMFSGAERSLDYYLSGRISVHNLRARGQTEGADFLLTRERATDETALLTPRNREVFCTTGPRSTRSTPTLASRFGKAGRAGTSTPRARA